MAKTNAERQAEYRARRPHEGADGNGERRLSLWVDTGTALALKRLARHSGTTQREVIRRLVAAPDDAIIATLEPKTPEWDAYFGPL